MNGTSTVSPSPQSPPVASGSTPYPSTNPRASTVKVALSFVHRVSHPRKPLPSGATSAAAGAATGEIGDDGGLSLDGGPSNKLPPQPIVTETEVIEPAAPGSTLGSSIQDDGLDAAVAPPPLEHSTVQDYVATAEKWLAMDQTLNHYEELTARGLLMIRNVVRSEPRYAAQESGNWLPLVREGLGSKYGLVRASAASALAAFAAGTPGREAIHKDSQVLPRLMQMLTNGLVSGGGDNYDTQYACLALANMALNALYRQPLVRYGVLPRAADVLRAAIRYLNTQYQQQQQHQPQLQHGTGAGGVAMGGAGGIAGGGGGGCVGGPGPRRGPFRNGIGSGNGSSGDDCARGNTSVVRSGTYVATLLTSWAVEPQGREQLQQYDVPRLASELYERCVAVLGEDHPLSRRLTLLADACSAAELLQEIAGGSGGPSGGGGTETGMIMMNWEATGQQQHPPEDRTEHAGEAGLAATTTATGSHSTQVNSSGGSGGPASSQATPNGNAHREVSFLDSSSRQGTASGAGVGTARGSVQRFVSPDPLLSPSGSSAGDGVLRTISKKQLAIAAAAAAAAASTATATTTTITATTTTTTSTSTSSTVAALLSPRDVPTGSGTTPRLSKLLSARPSHSGLTSFPSAALSQPPQQHQLYGGTAGGHTASPFAQRQHAFSEFGFHGLSSSSGCGALTPPPATPSQQQQQQQSSSVSTAGSMMGVHFSASILQEAAAAAAAAARGPPGGEDDLQRRSGSSLPPQLSSQPSSARALRLPSVAIGRLSSSAEGPLGSARSSTATGPPLSARGSEQHPYPHPSVNPHPQPGQRLELPFHLVRPIPTISATSGKVSRISAAYGQVSNTRQGSINGTAQHTVHTYTRGYTGEL
ncbi:hypothetical protein VOLCADRAFT_89881 [Volvox carteri f. nagariensis]|uniref:Uncharacterized protein n=1 Tax=Volvox carteri f. nagariensis TaxID=3068 RepID=D8TSW8_VOLCA|nr:uncharacterized protein VOLCADRAFT_89881 [Volvox carteri f. nagariensis]EFJ49554.1 hypothetical protein VOLCADRAFT_89881 [Volvox carteri f. nagariensis]|eukprot:XP_002949535.1 hypothetical protein VOLCADRAFT_89881 [Volvox carteri f. nagariensis]